MAENIVIEKKEDIIKLAKTLIDKKIPLTSNLANLSRLLMDGFINTSWSGFYLSDIRHETLYLGPFQGGIACTIIPYGKGVCGNSAKLKMTQLVPNVHEYPGHIACSSETNSEIVVPIIKNGKVYGVIDLDSNEFSNYNESDKEILEEVAKLIAELF